MHDCCAVNRHESEKSEDAGRHLARQWMDALPYGVRSSTILLYFTWLQFNFNFSSHNLFSFHPCRALLLNFKVKYFKQLFGSANRTSLSLQTEANQIPQPLFFPP